LTAWITALGFSVDIAVFSVPLMALGFLLASSKKTMNKNIGGFIIGFSIMFLGLSFMKSSAGELLSDKEAIMSFLSHFTGYRFGSVLIFLAVGAILTVVLQASSATMAITMLLATSGLIGFDLAAAMVLGENIGTTITANMAASVGNTSAKRAARAHTLFNVFGVVWVLVLFHPFLRLIGLIMTSVGLPDPLSADLTSADVQTQTSLLYGIATLHTLFNITNTLILIWFVPVIVKIVTWMVKTPEGEDEEVFRLKYISGGILDTAELSLDEARQEITYFAELCQKGYGYIRQAINEQDPDRFAELNKKLVKYEEITDKIEYEIAAYLGEVSRGQLSEASEKMIKAMYKIIGELESLGDSGEAIGRILQRKNAHEKVFDEDMLSRLNLMLDTVQTAYDAMLENLRRPYAEVNDISEALSAEDAIDACRNRLREEHIANIENENYNYQTGVYYMDVVAELERIGDFIINVSQAEEMVK
ncbi:MAG: Na/Pi symporter, partial [Bacteroidales bacterium]|nr:Na/Pi symporter [Bacteroidales bacterium]